MYLYFALVRVDRRRIRRAGLLLPYNRTRDQKRQQDEQEEPFFSRTFLPLYNKPD